jgi:hypothetical protein
MRPYEMYDTNEDWFIRGDGYKMRCFLDTSVSAPYVSAEWGNMHTYCWVNGTESPGVAVGSSPAPASSKYVQICSCSRLVLVYSANCGHRKWYQNAHRYNDTVCWYPETGFVQHMPGSVADQVVVRRGSKC